MRDSPRDSRCYAELRELNNNSSLQKSHRLQSRGNPVPPPGPSRASVRQMPRVLHLELLEQGRGGVRRAVQVVRQRGRDVALRLVQERLLPEVHQAQPGEEQGEGDRGGGGVELPCLRTQADSKSKSALLQLVGLQRKEEDGGQADGD